MIRKIDSKQMGTSNLGWLKSTFHFSFAEYYNPDNMNFGVLRVINDDLIDAGTGFDTHPHRDMEIITYVVDGELTHQDSMGNQNTLSRGHIQYMSAGTGVLHSEHNLGTKTLRLLQIWIKPDRKNYPPNYGDDVLEWDLRKNKWLQIVSPQNGTARIKINQDVNVYVLALDAGNKTNFAIAKGRQAYLVQIEGSAVINQAELNARDAMEIVEEDIQIAAAEPSHFLVIEMVGA